jgi:hypothetical protein
VAPVRSTCNTGRSVWRIYSANWRAAVLDYETFCQIRDHLGRQQLSVAQTARALALDVRTVSKWANVQQFQPRTGKPRVGKLDAYKGQIVR